MSEQVSIPFDSNMDGFPRHQRATKNGSPSVVWSTVPIFGQYPKHFVPWFAKKIGICRSKITHICSGALRPGEGLRIDIRPEVRPDIIADGRNLPLPDQHSDCVLIDPPYAEQYAEKLYQTDYPRPSHLLREASRICKAGGVIGFVHVIVPSPPAHALLESVTGIVTGCGYRIRALTIFRKQELPRIVRKSL